MDRATICKIITLAQKHAINGYLRAKDAIDKEIMQADRDVYSRVVS